MTPRKQYLIPVEDDRLPVMDVHSWAEDKYVRSTMYHLALFSRHPKGQEFWSEVLTYSSPQRELPFG